MELQFEKNMCRCLHVAAWEVQRQEQTQEVKLPEAMPDVGRVLGCWGQPVLRSKEWRSGGMMATGGVMTWTLYAPEDGSEPRCIESWIPIQFKWEFPETEREGNMAVSCMLRSADARTVSARKLMVRVCVNGLGIAMDPSETAGYTPGQVPEDVQLLQKTYPMMLPKEAGEKSFALDEELTLPPSAPAAQKLIRYELRPEIQEQRILGDRLVFRGTAVVHILYRTQEGQFQSWDLEIPFSQFAELGQELGTDSSTQIYLMPTSMEAELDEEGRIRLKAGLVAQYILWDRIMMDLVEDAYSPQRGIQLQEQMLDLPAMLEERRESCRSEQNMPCQGARVVDADYLPDYPNARRDGDNLILEVPGSFQVLYYDDQGNLQCAAARTESQWTAAVDQDARILASIKSGGTPQIIPSSDGITVKVDAVLDIMTLSGRGIPMVTALEMGELTEPDPYRPSLILRKVGNQGLWELAKASGSTVEAIRQANKLEKDPEAGRLLLIPVP